MVSDLLGFSAWRRLSARRPILTLTAPLLLLCLILVGCTIGPRQLKGNRLSYNVSIQKSNNEELLLNLVRLRYMEIPSFMQVSSVTSSFEYSLALQAEGGWARGDGYVDFPRRFLNPLLKGSYSESPTISFTPLAGEKFVASLLTDVTPQRFWFLHRSGWEIDLLLDLLVRRLGPLQNPTAFEYEKPEYLKEERKFQQFAGLLREFLRRDDFSLVYPDPAEKLPYELAMELRFRNNAEARSFESLLGTELKLSPLPDGRLLGQIFLSTKGGFKRQQEANLEGPLLRIRFRNFVGVLSDLINGVEVPLGEAEQGIVRRAAVPAEEPSTGAVHIIVHCVVAFPEKSLVAIRYRGHCFYIADNDFVSKRTFAFVSTLLALQSGETKSTAPVLTLPV
ncbi:MAG: hypothetical protein P8X65_14405, partial [Syntrophobacterales bacterium]